MISTNGLKGVIATHGDTQAQLAAYLGIKEETLSVKINNKRDFSRAEVEMIAMRYGLNDADMRRIFFPSLVTSNATSA